MSKNRRKEAKRKDGSGVGLIRNMVTGSAITKIILGLEVEIQNNINRKEYIPLEEYTHRDDAARIAVALRLGTKVCEPHQCICGDFVASNGHHGLSCNSSKGKYSRHAEINKKNSLAFTSAGFPNSLEPYGISRRDGKRPDGITSYPWSNGKSLIWDVTVVDRLAASYWNLASVNGGAVADQAEREKHNNYIDLKNNYNFTPLAFESLGSIGPETELFLKILGKLMKRQTGEPRSLDFLLQRVSIAIQRGNAICIRNSFRDDNEFNVFL